MYIENETFKGLNHHTKPLEKAEYEYCTFMNCDFSNSNLSGFKFMECEFEGCNFSNAKIVGTGFKQVLFRASKLMGLQFDKCDPFNLEFTFDNCMLDHSIFYQLKIKKTHFTQCRMVSVDFSEADLTMSSFDNCDLSGALFDNTNLEQSDFRTAQNFGINPQYTRLAGAKFAKENLVGLLHHLKLKIE